MYCSSRSKVLPTVLSTTTVPHYRFRRCAYRPRSGRRCWIPLHGQWPDGRVPNAGVQTRFSVPRREIQIFGTYLTYSEENVDESVRVTIGRSYSNSRETGHSLLPKLFSSSRKCPETRHSSAFLREHIHKKNADVKSAFYYLVRSEINRRRCLSPSYV